MRTTKSLAVVRKTLAALISITAIGMSPGDLAGTDPRGDEPEVSVQPAFRASGT